MSVPAGRCGPCCSTLPAGRMTSGFAFSCAAISGWVNSMKYRLGNTAAPLPDARPRLVEHLRHADGLSLPLDRPQRRVDDGERDVAVARVEAARPAGAAGLGEHLELCLKHIARAGFQHLAARVAAL